MKPSLCDIPGLVQEASRVLGGDRFVRVHDNPDNRGFGGSFNQAWRDPTLNSFDLFLQLSVDIGIPPGVLAMFTERTTIPEEQSNTIWMHCYYFSCPDNFAMTSQSTDIPEY